jgi:MFS family permease
MVRNVGHIRVFAALTALASSTILAHGVFLTPVLWTLARAITGFSFAGLYIVIESWINSLANCKTRGSVLAIYMVIRYSALAIGQMCLYIAPPESINPFILVSILVSLAAIPVSLSRRPAPSHTENERLSLKELWIVSPLSFYAVTLSGFCTGTLYALAPVYGAAVGMSTNSIANFMALFLLGGIFGQLPLGIVSDYIGRRKTIIGVTLGTAVMAMFCFFFAEDPLYLNIFFFLLGSLSLTIYALGSALAIDYLDPRQYLSAASSLLIINGAGAIIGPIVISMLMSYHSWLFFPSLAVFYLSITLFGMYRSTIREAMPTEDQEGYLTTPTGVTQAQDL